MVLGYRTSFFTFFPSARFLLERGGSGITHKPSLLMKFLGTLPLPLGHVFQLPIGIPDRASG